MDASQEEEESGEAEYVPNPSSDESNDHVMDDGFENEEIAIQEQRQSDEEMEESSCKPSSKQPSSQSSEHLIGHINPIPAVSA
jgi:hypothetical protein